MSLSTTLSDTLARGVDALGLSLSDDQQRLLLAYVDLLVKWNQAYNLTAIRDPAEMVTRHLLDSLAVLPYVADTDTLLDSNGKKTRFVRQARRELGLDNVEVVHARVEQYGKSPSQIICRAFASLSDMLALMAPIITDNTRVLAMKAASTERELATMPPHWQGNHHSLNIPGLDEPRTLVVVQQRSD